MSKEFPTRDEESTMQMKKIWEDHHDPEKREKLRRKKLREKRKESKIKDYGL